MKISPESFIRLGALLALWLAAPACKKGEPEPDRPFVRKTSVFVVCEGAFGSGNSALTSYDPDSGIVVTDLYRARNEHSLGDVFQSMTLISNSSYFLCVNNSDRINVIGYDNLQDRGTIAVPKPRYALQVSDAKVYISTLFSNKVYVVDPKKTLVTDSIAMPHMNPEGMLRVGRYVYVATWDTASTAIYPIDVETDVVGPPVKIAGPAPSELLQDGEGMLWVLAGNKPQGVPATLTRLNPATGDILKRYAFGSADPMRLTKNNAGDSLYFIEVSYNGGGNNGIFRMGIHDATVPAQAFIAASSSPTALQYFYGLGIHPRSGNIYVADPRGFINQGAVSVYRPDGRLVDSFSTGVGPGHFLFE